VTLPPDLRAALESIYEEVMWLSQRPNVTPGRARAWYTHIMAEHVKRQLRHFTGLVSSEAARANGEDLRLEHYMRIQTTLSALVERHRRDQIHDPAEFVRILQEFERVHIVTRSENYAAMRAKGDYEVAGIRLLPWATLAIEKRQLLWRRMLKGRVANAGDYFPRPEA
jgi:hypothetical protein